MTITEAIKQIEGSEAVLLNRIFTEFNNALLMAIDALEEKMERENPKKLTIKELQQMDGQPVWMEDENVWGTINIDDYGQFEGKPFICFKWKGCSFDWDIEARGLTCYRHKPKEE